MKLEISENEYGQPLLEYKSNEDYFKYRDIYSRSTASKLHYNSLKYHINDLVNDMAKIIKDYGNYKVVYVLFDGILLEENNQRVHVFLNEEYDSLNELYNHLITTKNQMENTRIDYIYIILQKQ